MILCMQYLANNILLINPHYELFDAMNSLHARQKLFILFSTFPFFNAGVMKVQLSYTFVWCIWCKLSLIDFMIPNYILYSYGLDMSTTVGT